MTSLLLVTTGLRPEMDLVAGFARARQWAVREIDYRTGAFPHGAKPTAFYGDTVCAARWARERCFVLLEPPLDALASLPRAMVRRDIGFCRADQLSTRTQPLFVKPADALAKTFHARVYSPSDDLAGIMATVSPATPVLHSTPVEWTVELRAVVRARNILSLAAYVWNGVRIRPDADPVMLPAALRDDALAFCDGLLGLHDLDLPPAFVLDIGLIGGKWAVVELNPLWCSRFFGVATPAYLDALADLMRPPDAIAGREQRWLIDRSAWHGPGV